MPVVRVSHDRHQAGRSLKLIAPWACWSVPAAGRPNETDDALARVTPKLVADAAGLGVRIAENQVTLRRVGAVGVGGVGAEKDHETVVVDSAHARSSFRVAASKTDG